MSAVPFAKYVSPGVYQVKETGGVVTATLDRILPDGSMFSAPENAHLFSTVDAIICAEYPKAPSSVGQQGSSIPGVVSHFAVLVQWMKTRGIHYFGHLTPADLTAFIHDCSCGLDAVLKSQERIAAVAREKLRQSPAWRPNFDELMSEAGIPKTQASRVPAARRLLNEFLATGKLPPPIPLPPRQVTTGILWGRAKCLQLLWGHRTNVADGLSFEPSVAEIAKAVNAYGKPEGHTRDLPVDYTCNLVALAFTWVYEYGPLLADVQRALNDTPTQPDERKAYLHGTLDLFNATAESRGWPIRLKTWKAKRMPDHFTWQTAACTFVPAACFTICGIFTARRITELVSILTQSLRGNAETGHWYSSYVGKRAKNDSFPCTRSVADSIRALAYLKELRGIPETEPAFAAIRGTGRLKQRLRNALAGFGKLVKAELPEGVTQWDLAPHQFRKIFALIYKWKYDHPALIALAVYYGHINLKPIQAYINSPEWKRDYFEASQQFTLEKMRDIADGRVEPKGIFGKLLKRLITRALSQVELADAREETEALMQLIEERQLDLRANLYGYCGARSVHSNLRRAKCTSPGEVRSKATIDPEKSSEDTCAGCLFFYTNQSRKIIWIHKTERLERSVAAAPQGSMAQQKMRERLQIIESFTRNNFAEAAQ